MSFYFVRFEMFFIAPLILAGLSCVSPGAAALGKSDRWPTCREAAPEARLAACTEILASKDKMTRRDRIAAYINRSSAYRSKGDLDAALADLGKALLLNPKSPLALTKRASIYHEKGDFGRAISAFSEAIAAKPKSAAAYQGRGEAYRATGELDKALSDFDTAARLDPEDPTIYAARGAIHRTMGKEYLDRAIADYGQAIALAPRLAAAYNNRGLAFFAKDNVSKALADFSAAVELDPKFAEAFFNRANAYASKDEFERAGQDYEAALKLDPRLLPAKEALDDLNRRLANSAKPASPVPASPKPASPVPNHQNLPWPLALPFAGMLLSIALGPLVVKEWWHIHYEKAAAFWAILTIGGLVIFNGAAAAAASVSCMAWRSNICRSFLCCSHSTPWRAVYPWKGGLTPRRSSIRPSSRLAP